ncbi:MAG: response regulator [Verrucomicrobiota bacterium]
MPTSFTPNANPAARTLRVLYAEDLPELRELMRLVLRRDGHTLESCEDGSLAYARLLHGPQDFDLLLTDHHMPVMNGLELVRRVRQTAYAGRIVVFSSELDPAVQEAYEALKVDRVLSKPVLPMELRRTVNELFPAAPVA